MADVFLANLASFCVRHMQECTKHFSIALFQVVANPLENPSSLINVNTL